MTSCNGWRKGKTTEVRNQVRVRVRYEGMTYKTSRNNCKLPQRTKKSERGATKAKRIAQVSFQARIDASSMSTTARSKSGEIQNKTIDAS